MYYLGIDIGSTATKSVLLDERNIYDYFVLPTGWSSKETAGSVLRQLGELHPEIKGQGMKTVATGYGRISVDFADKQITEISCHAKGAATLFGPTGTVIDIGGQDTKIIRIRDGVVDDFVMNDKCSAGTGKFLEIMANRLGVGLPELFEMAEAGRPLAISATCTVFAESEVISHIGNGAPRPDLAAGVVESVVAKVAALYGRLRSDNPIFLTGGLCESAYLLKRLENQLGRPVSSLPMARYAGALGAALYAKNL